MDIGFFFSYKNKIIQLPINPAKLAVSYKSGNKSTEIIEVGEVTLPKSRKLSTISFNCWFPYDTWFPGIRTLGDFEQPEFYKKFFIGLMDDAKECRFIVTGLDINMLVTIESFEPTHQAGIHEDCEYAIQLKEFRPYSIVQISDDNFVLASSTASTVSSSSEEITIGCDVMLNGRVFGSSYGDKPGKTFSNYKGKINFINKKGSYPYHVTTPSGGWLGWANSGSVSLI